MNTNNDQLNPCEEYIRNFAKRYDMTVEEASEKAIVKAVLAHYNEVGM